MNITCAFRSETGKVRSANEDSFVAEDDLGLFAVCDGMGGHRGGATASELAATHVAAYLNSNLTNTRPNGAQLELLMENAVLSAHETIRHMAGQHAEYAGMGTTCTVALIADAEHVVMGHVGDSRLYRARTGEVQQISEDHSLVNELLKSGAITAEEALVHPQSNIITQALGTATTPKVELRTFTVEPGDTFMLCSDGLSHYFPYPADLVEAMAEDDLQQGVDQLVHKALTSGGHDNVTCVMFRV